MKKNRWWRVFLANKFENLSDVVIYIEIKVQHGLCSKSNRFAHASRLYKQSAVIIINQEVFY